MEVGDLVQYKGFPQDGQGVVLENNAGYILVWFTDTDNSHYLWENEWKLEVVCKQVIQYGGKQPTALCGMG